MNRYAQINTEDFQTSGYYLKMKSALVSVPRKIINVRVSETAPEQSGAIYGFISTSRDLKVQN